MVTFFQFLSKKQNDNLKLENMFNDYRLCGPTGFNQEFDFKIETKLSKLLQKLQVNLLMLKQI